MKRIGRKRIRGVSKFRIAYLRFFARRIVTPFAPLILSDAFLAPEVEDYGLRGLNFRSINLEELNAWPTGACPIIFVQVDQLDIFVRDILPKATGKFTLITGKWHLPGLKLSESVYTLLASSHLERWYSQNQIYKNVPILPFPYGVNLWSAPRVFWRMVFHQILGIGRSGVFIPHATLHVHLEGSSLSARRNLAPKMQPWLSLPAYLNKILRHRYVVSPPGDRPDTYRHRESVALGAIVVSSVPGSVADLFGQAMLQIDDFCEIDSLTMHDSGCAPRPAIATLRHWQSIVRNRS